MKIENNNGTAPVGPKRTEGVSSSGKTRSGAAARVAVSGKDRAEVTESARLLAKARAALDNAGEVENERLEMLRQQVENGTYEIPAEELARRLLARRSLLSD